MPSPPSAVASTVLVVGGGLAGLATAAWLRANGVATCVLEAESSIGGRLRVPASSSGADVGWFVDRPGSAFAAFFSEARLPAPSTTPLALKVVTERAGALGTGSLGFVTRTGVAGFGARLSVRGSLAASARKIDRLDQFWTEQDLRGGALALMHALAGPAGAEVRTTPASAYAVARDLVLDRRRALALTDGTAALLARLAAAAGDVRCGARVEALVSEERLVRGVRLAGGEIVEGRSVVLALSPAEARSLFDDAAWARLPNEERIRWEACVPRRAARVAFHLETPANGPWLAFAADPPAWIAAPPSRGGESSGVVVAHIGLAADAPESAAVAEAARLARSLALLLPGFSAASARREIVGSAIDDGAARLAGGRDPLSAALTGFDNLFLAGDGIVAAPPGLDRVFASAREAGRAARAG